MDIGYIKTFRKITEWEWYTDSETKSLFLHLIIKANVSDSKWRGTVIKRGQVLTSIDKLHTETGLSVKQVRTALKHLQMTGEIVYQTASKGANHCSLITVSKYGEYQGTTMPQGASETASETASERAAKGQDKGTPKGKRGARQRATLKEEENVQEGRTKENNQEEKKRENTTRAGASLSDILKDYDSSFVEVMDIYLKNLANAGYPVTRPNSIKDKAKMIYTQSGGDVNKARIIVQKSIEKDNKKNDRTGRNITNTQNTDYQEDVNAIWCGE